MECLHMIKDVKTLADGSVKCFGCGKLLKPVGSEKVLTSEDIKKMFDDPEYKKFRELLDGSID